MKAIFPMFIGIGLACSALGQDATDESSLADQVQKAIQEFNRLKADEKEPKKEVVVVLPPPAPNPEEAPPVAVPVEEPLAQDEKPPTPAQEPKLVTGRPPAVEPSDETVPAVDESPLAKSEEPLESAPKKERGLEIRVESIREGSGNLDPGKVTLTASFAAKSLSPAPDGWILEKSEQAPAIIQDVTLRPGKTISLSIRPHVLVPASDGSSTFAVVEPGYDVSEGYRQSNTVSAILGNSVAQLDRDALLLGNAISDLHQLLSSLPKPEPDPKDSPKP